MKDHSGSFGQFLSSFTSRKPGRRLLSWSENRHRIAAICFVLLGALTLTCLYWAAIRTDYFFDDLQAFGGDLDDVSLPGIEAIRSPQSRPMLQAWFWLITQWSDSAVVVYRLSGLLIHGLNCILVYQLVRLINAMLKDDETLDGMGIFRQTSAQSIGVFVASIWLIHPVVAQTVCAIVQQAESIATMFLILYLIVIVRCQSWTRWKVAIVLQAILALGLYTKFILIAAVPAGLILDAMLQKKSILATLRSRWLLHTPPVIVAALAVVLLAPALIRAEGGVGFGGEAPPTIVYLMTSARSFVHYAVLTFVPIELSIDRSPRWIITAQEALPWVLLSVAYVLVTVWLWCRSVPANQTMGRFIAWLLGMPLIVLLPTSSFVPTADPFFEHRIYFAMVFWIWLALVLVDSQLARLPITHKSKLVIGVCILLTVGIALTLRTHLRIKDYATPQSIWQSALLVDADNSRAAQNFVAAMQEAGLHDAIDDELTQIAVNADARGRSFDATVHQLAKIKLQKGQTDAAIQILNQLRKTSRKVEDCITVRQRREIGELWFDSAIAHLQNRDPNSAMATMENVLQATPNDPIAKQLALEIQQQLRSEAQAD